VNVADSVAGNSVPKPHSTSRGFATSRERRRALVIADPGRNVLTEPRRFAGLDVVGRIELSAGEARVARALADYRPDLILVEASLVEIDFELLRRCSAERIQVLVLFQPGYGLAFGGPIVRLGGLPWLRIRPLPLDRRHRLAKRAFDLGLLLLAAPVLIPGLAVIALAVALTSPGGVLYRQTRLGKDGKPFTLLKFRSMDRDAERETGVSLARLVDPRVTSVGAVLRRLRLDELPQLWNVLRGDMSLVGPRPERPELMSGFQAIHGYEARHFVLPGLTGIAQLVGGYRATAAEKLRCDLVYLTSGSLGLDVRLIGLTLLDLVRGFPNA
jgi:lipopolysaccharide/colanic/teichoic acid biosynthesis glycosyltransferase